AASPCCLLTMDYFEQTGFFDEGAGRRLVRQPLELLKGGKMESSIGEQLQAIDRELFEHHAGARPPVSLFVIPYLFVFAAFAIGEYCYRRWFEPPLDATEVVESDQSPAAPSQKA